MRKLLIAAMMLIVWMAPALAQEFQAGGVYGNPNATRGPATDSTLQQIINQSTALTIPSPTISGTATFPGNITAPNLPPPGTIAASICATGTGAFLYVAGAPCFAGSGGTGTIASGTANQLGYYASSGTTISGTSTIPAAVQSNITATGTVTSGTWNGTAIGLTYGGLGGSQAAATANQIPVFPGSGGAATPTSYATFLNALCSSVVGQYWVQLTGGWGCTTLPFANPVWWGADPTGAADSTSAFTSAFAAKSAILVPPGKFKYTSLSYSLSGTSSFTLWCAGPDNTILLGTAGGLTINYSGVNESETIRGCSFTTTSSTGQFVAVTLQNNSGLQTLANNLIQDVTCRGDDGYGATDYFAGCLNDVGVSNVQLSNVAAWGSCPGSPCTGPAGGYCFQFSGLTATQVYAVVFDISTSTVCNYTTFGLIAGDFTQGYTVSQSNFDGNTEAIYIPPVTSTSDTYTSGTGALAMTFSYAPGSIAFGAIFNGSISTTTLTVTSVASATVNAAGSGFTASTGGTMTWSGAGCSTNPVLNVTTNSGGNIAGVSSIKVAGNCSSFPSSSATTWTAGGGISGGSGASFNLNTVITAGQNLVGSGVTIPTTISSGSGGTFTISPSQTVSSTSMSSGDKLQVQNCTASTSLNGNWTVSGLSNSNKTITVLAPSGLGALSPTGCAVFETNIAQLTIADSQFGMFFANSIAVLASSPVDALNFHHNSVGLGSVNGINNISALDLVFSSNTEIDANTIGCSSAAAGNNQIGISMGGQYSYTSGTIANNIFAGCFIGGQFLASANNDTVIGNRYILDTFNFNDFGVGDQILDNPLGSGAVSVGASPWTYTASSHPETLYVRSGIVSIITVGGNQVAAASPATVQLGPNESMVVTYSSLPTVVRDQH